MQSHAYLYKLEFQKSFSDLYSKSTGHGGFIRNKKDRSMLQAQILGVIDDTTPLFGKLSEHISSYK